MKKFLGKQWRTFKIAFKIGYCMLTFPATDVFHSSFEVVVSRDFSAFFISLDRYEVRISRIRFIFNLKDDFVFEF
jgi:hypothetical protein